MRLPGHLTSQPAIRPYFPTIAVGISSHDFHIRFGLQDYVLLIFFSSGHYVENTSKTEKLIWIELYKSERVADISLTQWLALTPPDLVANTLNISLAVVKQLKKEKQILLADKS